MSPSSLAALPLAAATVELPWLPSWGWSFHFRLDGLGALYALLAVGVAIPVLVYAAAYLPHHLREHGQPPRRRTAVFYGWMGLFLASMVGLALAADLVLLFVFFDLTALCSWALIGFDRERAEARKAALTALLVTAIPSVGFLVGVLLLQHRYGTLDVAELAARAAGDGTTAVAMALVLVAALAKSAQVPLHFWLPRAMVAPTPVSAYLHSAAMVAAGVFVLHRLHPLLPPAVETATLAAGWLSVFTGGLLALTARGLKRILAYSTVAHYGHVTVLLGLGGAGAAAAAAVYVAVHAVAKSTLFLVAGAVTRATGEDELPELGGLARRLPLLAASAGVAAAALVGFPLTAGFFKDEAFFHELSRSGGWSTVGGSLALALTVAYMWRFWSGVFLGSPRGRDGTGTRAVPAALVLPPAALALPLLVAGFTGGTLAAVGQEAAAAVHGGPPHFELAYHLDLRLTNRMALGGWVLGLALVASRRLWGARLSRLATAAGAVGPARLWDRGLHGLNVLSDGFHRFELRDLRDRLASIMLPAGALVLLALAVGSGVGRYELGAPVHQEPGLVLALAAVMVAAVATVSARSHLGLVLFLSGVGYSLAVVFAVLGGPDLALVAVLVETALTLLFLVALWKLPSERIGTRSGHRRPRLRALWHLAAALTAACISLLVAWVGLSNPAPETVAAEYVRLAETAHAKNVVAAILADFRGLDTLGEVSVLIVALLGLMAFLGGWGRAPGGRR